MTPTYELLYFDMRGRAEPIRLLLTLAGIPFTDSRLTFPTWPGQKPTTPLGQVPVLIERDAAGNETRIPQSMAILRHLARRHGLYGTSDSDMLQADMVCDTVVDLRAAFAPISTQGIFGTVDPVVFNTFLDEQLPVHLRRIDVLLDRSRSTTGLFVHDEPTFADCVAHATFEGFLALDPKALDAFPRLVQFHERMCKLPAIEARRQTLPPHDWTKMSTARVTAA